MTASYVYFLQVMPEGPIKIGYTTGNVKNRLAALQQTSPHILKWIGAFKGTKIDEHAAHRLLANSRCRSEWFYPTTEVLAFVREKCPEFCEKKLTDEIYLEEFRSVVERLLPLYGRHNNDVLNQVLKASGLDAWTFWKWFHRERMLDVASARKAAECAALLLNEVGRPQ